MKKNMLLLVVLLGVSFHLTAQDRSLYKKEVFVLNNDTLPYRILLPVNYDASKKYPLILVLHGAGERGNDNEAQLVHGSYLFLKDSIRERFPAIVVFPQCPVNSFWSNVKFNFDTATHSRSLQFLAEGEPSIAMKLAQELLFKIIKEYPVNKKQVYVGGLSMGGMGTFEIVRRNPALFAAAFPICGGGAAATAPAIKKVKWWVFHGAADAVVPASLSQEMVDALKAAGADVKFSLYPGVDHNSWDNAFAEPDLLPWLFAQHK
jgi:predicted peptidase